MPTRRARQCVILGLLFVLHGAQPQLQSPSLDVQLLAAVREGDGDAVAALLAQGADVNAKSEYGITPIMFAADNADAPLVKLLLEHGADPNERDLQYGKTPLYLVAYSGNDKTKRKAREEIISLLLESGATGTGVALGRLIREEYFDAVRTIIRRGGVDVDPVYLNRALSTVRGTGQAELVELLIEAGATDQGPVHGARAPERLELLVGVYRSQSGGDLTITFDGEFPLLQRTGQRRVILLPALYEVTLFRTFESTAAHTDKYAVVVLPVGPLPPTELALTEGGRSEVFKRVADGVEPTHAAELAPLRTPSSEVRPLAPPASAATGVGAGDWPSFRGARSSGVAEGARPPTEWDVEAGINVKWMTAIPGLAHSSPIVWGDRVFVTTATTQADATFMHGADAGNAGSSRRAGDIDLHAWRVYALDRQSGKILWERVAHEGMPKTDRHVMQSQADSTPATDGTHLVVFFGSEGLYCYDLDGRLLWKRDLGPIVTGMYQYPDYEWTTSTSPVIYNNLVILQLDLLLKNSFIVAFDLEMGTEVWRTERDERAGFTTPLIYAGAERTEVVTAGSEFARGYDPDTGRELWRFGKHSSTTVPTPIVADDLIFITSGNGVTIQPIYAIRPGATGKFTLEDGDDSNEYIVWSRRRGGPYLPTPVLYGGLLYVRLDNGVLSAYRAATGERLYQERLTRGDRYTASGVAADGKLYFPNEDGEVVVVKAGPTFEVLSVNRTGDVIMASPAISHDALIVRTLRHLVALAEPEPRHASRHEQRR